MDTKEKIITGDSTMESVMIAYPGARRALFRQYHIGGCSSCGFKMNETLGDICGRNNNLDVDEVLAEIQLSHKADSKILIEPKVLAEEIESNPNLKLLDIRTREEFEAVKLEGSIHMTRDLMQEILGKWDPEEPFVIIDHQGQQSMDAAAYFIGHDIKNVRCLRGGIDAWSVEVDDSAPRYEFA